MTLLADNHYLPPRTPEMNDPNARDQLGEVGQTTAPRHPHRQVMIVTTKTVALPARVGQSPEDFQRLGVERGRMAPWEDGAHNDGSPGTFEWWYIDAEVDGSTLAIFMMTKPFVSHDLPLTPSVTVSLRLPDGSTIEKVATVPANEFSAAKDVCDVRMGPNDFRGDLHSYRVHVEIDDFVADVELTGTVPAWRPGTGYIFFGEHDQDFFATSQPVPLGVARVSLRGKDLDLSGSGPGYIDRGWTNVPQVKLIHDWYWARVEFGDYLVLAADITAEKGYGYREFKEFLVTRDGRILADVLTDTDDVIFKKSDVHIDPDTGKPVANMFSYEYRDGQTRYTVTFKREKDFLHIKFIDAMTGAELEKARAANYDGALLRFTGTATFVHSEGDKIVYTEQRGILGTGVLRTCAINRPRPPLLVRKHVNNFGSAGWVNPVTVVGSFETGPGASHLSCTTIDRPDNLGK